MATLKNSHINDSGYLRVPRGTTGQRSGNPEGALRYNTDKGAVEYYSTLHNTAWQDFTIPWYTRQIVWLGTDNSTIGNAKLYQTKTQRAQYSHGKFGLHETLKSTC